MQIFGNLYLRPYGTFPHPNVLAAYLIVSLIILRSKILTILVGFAAIGLTYSKAAYLALVTFPIFLLKSLRTLLLASIFLLILVWVFLKQLPQSQFASIAERLVLVQASLDIAFSHPIFGVGSGNFIAQLAKLNLISIGEIRLLQPVHNVFLLILAENGLLGLFLFLFLLLAIAKKADSPIKIALFVSILIFATFDHFLWTLQQGRLLFWVATAYILAQPDQKTQKTQ